MTIKVSDFSIYTGLRHSDISDDSGEEYYHSILNDSFNRVIEASGVLTVILDGTAGYAPSFIDEAFGNLVYDFGLSNVKDHIKLISEQEPYWIDKVYNDTFEKWNERRLNGPAPKKTEQHKPWWKIDLAGNKALGVWA